MAKIKENWKEIERLEKVVQDQKGDPKAGFNADLFFIGKEGKALLIPIKFRNQMKRDGEMVFTKSYKETKVVALFCPFTGKPLYDDSISKSEEK